MVEDKDKLTREDTQKERDRIHRRVSEMKLERSSFEAHYRDLSEFVDPRRGRFFVTDRNKGDKRHKSILNSKATVALRKATAGMLAGAMSPSRPWFKWTTFDGTVDSDMKAKQWLELLQKLTLMVLSKSNFYNMAPTMLRELLLFGTGCMTHVDDFEDVARFYTHTVGSYMIAQDHRLVVDTIAREFQMTAQQLVGKFGVDAVSQSVRNNYDNGNYDAWHTVVHFIEPNPYRDDNELGSEFLPFRSVYYEPGKNREGFLSVKGFKRFPAYVPRWELTGEDIYATNCPGMTSLGDVKQLQVQEREKAKAIAKSVTPPLQGPASLRNQPISNLPGGVTTHAASASGGKIEALYQVDPRTQEILLDIDKTERRIDEAFFVQLFMAITEMQGIQPKNQLQLSQINEERLLQIGPVLEQVHGEWLSKMVQRVAEQILDAGIMPEAPKSLQGQDLDLEFVSALAMAQRSVATSAIERTVAFAGGLREAGWDVSDKINADGTLNEYANLVGMPARLVVPDEEAEQRRQARAQQMRQAEAMEQAQKAANIAKMASDAKLDDENVLSTATGRA